MGASKPLPIEPVRERSSKQERERDVLLGLVAYYIKTMKPVGSETLKEVGFPHLSSATIRNYFQNLEEAGFLAQHHTSSGRIPTAKAFRLYAQLILDDVNQRKAAPANLPIVEDAPQDIKEVMLFLQRFVESVSEKTGCPCFLSSPRFDQDFVVEIKLLAFEAGRCLSVLFTNFGVIHTEVLHSPHKLSQHEVMRIESYFRSRLASGAVEPDEMTQEELELAHRFYQESMARYLVAYSNFSQEELLRVGFSKLLRYPEFQEAERLTSSLSLFENSQALRALVRDVLRAHQMKFWIGEDLLSFLSSVPNCSVIAAPYTIGPKCVGAIGLIGPMRMPYQDHFQALKEAERTISKYLTENLYKYKIGYRSSYATPLELDFQEHALLIMKEPRALLEDKQTKQPKKK